MVCDNGNYLLFQLHIRSDLGGNDSSSLVTFGPPDLWSRFQPSLKLPYKKAIIFVTAAIKCILVLSYLYRLALLTKWYVSTPSAVMVKSSV